MAWADYELKAKTTELISMKQNYYIKKLILD